MDELREFSITTKIISLNTRRTDLNLRPLSLPLRSVKRIFNNTRFLTLGFLLFAALITTVKLLRLSSRELWIDESYSALLSSMGWKQMFGFIVGDIHPPLYYMVLWGWVRIAGNSEAVLRLFSVLLSTAALAAIFFVARKWLGTRAAVFVAVLFALSPMLYVYSLEVRMYMLAVLLTIAILGLHRVVSSETEQSPLYLLLYAFGCALLYYTHYIGLFVIAGLFADWVLVAPWRSRSFRRLSIAALIVLFLTAPWLPIMFHQRSQKLAILQQVNASILDPASLAYGETIRSRSSLSVLSTHIRQDAVLAFGFYPTHPLPLKALLGLPLAICLAGALWLAVRGDRICRLFVLVAIAVFCGMLQMHVYELRYSLPLLPFLFLAISRPLQQTEKPRERMIATALAVLIVATYAVGFVHQATRKYPRDWSTMVSTLKSQYRENDVIVFHPMMTQVLFDYYAGQVGFRPREIGFPQTIYSWWLTAPVKGWAPVAGTKNDLGSVAAELKKRPQPSTVWLVLGNLLVSDPKGQLRARLEETGEGRELKYARILNTPSVNPPNLTLTPKIVAISAVQKK